MRRLQEISSALGEPIKTFLMPSVPSAEVLKENATEVVPFEEDWREFAPLAIDPVLAGAIEAFVLTGYHGATMRSIAQIAKMSVPGVYHHYATKQDLLVKILDITMSDLTWRLQQARGQARESIDAVELVVEALALFHAKRCDLALIGASEMRSLQPAHYQRIAQQRDDVQRLLDSVILAAILDGDLNVPHPKEVGRAVTSMCTSIARWFRPDGPTSPEVLATRYGCFALTLLGGFVEGN